MSDSGGAVYHNYLLPLAPAHEASTTSVKLRNVSTHPFRH